MVLHTIIIREKNMKNIIRTGIGEIVNTVNPLLIDLIDK